MPLVRIDVVKGRTTRGLVFRERRRAVRHAAEGAMEVALETARLKMRRFRESDREPYAVMCAEGPGKAVLGQGLRGRGGKTLVYENLRATAS